MNVVGKVGSLISQGVYSVATPFHPFGGAVDVIVVQQQDGTFRSTPWYVRFGKFQGVLKGSEKVVGITVNGVQSDFHMCLDNSGEAYFVREVDAGTNGGMQDSDCEVGQDGGNKHIAQFCRLEHSVSESRVALLRDELDSVNPKRLERSESDTRFYEFQDEQSSLEDSVSSSEFGLGQYKGEAQDSDSEVVLVSVDGHILTAPVSEQNPEDVKLSTPKFHIEPCNNACIADCSSNKLGSVEDTDSSHDVCSVNCDVGDVGDAVPVEREEPSDDSIVTSTSSSRRWKLWSIPFTKGKGLEHSDSNASSDEVFVDTESDVKSSQPAGSALDSSRKQSIRTNVPTNEQIASMNLKDGQNEITFSFSTRVFGNQQVEAHLYLWKWNDKIVISDVDGTITKSDVLGQFMPLVGRDWTQSGVAKLFSAIKENGYQLLFLSARAIVQAYITRNFLLNLKQDGKALPNGPVVISPDGLFPSLYREVIRRAPHEFKIACLEDIKKLFPSDHNPFYAGFGNRDTDELSYRKIGIPKGKIFIINPKGQVAISQRIDERSYTSLHTLVDDMFPPVSMVEHEDFNSWNFWKVPLLDVE